MTKFKRLVAYGCSYTQGQEMIDEQYIPGANEIKLIQGRDEFWQAFRKKYPDLTKESYNELGKSHAWPRHLADRIGIPWINNASPGNSNYNMIYRLDRDLANGEILDTDLVIIGITSPNRLIYINPAGGEDTLHLGYLHGWPIGLKHGYPFFIKWMLTGDKQTVGNYNFYSIKSAEEKEGVLGLNEFLKMDYLKYYK